jgi:predicted ester cyclase
MSHRKFLDRWFEEVWCNRNESMIDELVSKDCLIHGLPTGGPRGPEGFRPVFRAFTDAFPNIHMAIDDSVEDKNKIGFRCTGVFTKADGEEIKVAGGGMVGIQDGKIVEAWNVWDFMEMLAKLKTIQGTELMNTLAQLTEEQHDDTIVI